MITSDDRDVVGEREHSYPTRAALGAMAGLLAVHAVLAWLARPAGIDRWDDAAYYLLARSLRHFSYVELWTVGSPAHRLYPPGFPALLSLWSLVGGRGLTAQAVLGICLSVAGLAVAYLLAARYLDRRVAIAGLAVLAVNPYLVDLAGHIASEMPYALWSLLALLVMLRQGMKWGMLAAGALAIVAALTREAGATLLVALVLALLLQRRLKAAAALALASVVTLGAWFAWAAAAPEKSIGNSYVADALSSVGRVGGGTGPVAVLAGRLLHNTMTYAIQMLTVVVQLPTVQGTNVDDVVWLLVVAAGLAVGLAGAWSRCRPVVLYLLCYGALLLAWPFAIGRFLLPIAGLLVPLWLWGVWRVLQRVSGSRSFIVPGVAAALLVAIGLWGSLAHVRELWGCDRETARSSRRDCLPAAERDYRVAMQWIRDSTPPDVAVVATKPPALYFYGNRMTIPYEATVAWRPDSLLRYLAARNGQYVVLTSYNEALRPRLTTSIAAACEGLRVTAEFNPRAYVLRLRDPRDADSTNACAAVAAYQRAIADPATSGR